MQLYPENWLVYPENWLAAFGLAILHRCAEQPDEARRLLKEAIRLGSDEARAEAQLYPPLFLKTLSAIATRCSENVSADLTPVGDFDMSARGGDKHHPYIGASFSRASTRSRSCQITMSYFQFEASRSVRAASRR